MISIRKFTPVCLVAASAVALSQTPPPAPPAAAAAPAPVAIPAPAATPWPSLAPEAPVAPFHFDAADFPDLNFDFHVDIDADQIREQVEMARENAEMARDQVRNLRDQMQLGLPGTLRGFAFAPQAPVAPVAPMAPMRPVTPQPGRIYTMTNRGGSADSLYQRGLSALDSHRYDQALDNFTEVVTRGGARADGALYWKAYTLNKLGRRDDATAALAELRKSYANSRWLDDAKALELEVKQSSGQKVSPESESNDELKLLALEGLAQSDPDRAFSSLERLLKGPQSPNLKKRAIYVLALSNSARSQQLLEQIARGGGNPDLQMTAIQYLGNRGSKDANKNNVLFEIYNSSTDPNVKRGVMSALLSNRDKDHLLQIAKTDKSPEQRQEAVRMLGSMAAQPEMWQLYQSETDPDVKRAILEYVSGSTDKLIEIAKIEKDAKLRRSAIQRLASTKAPAAHDALIQIYGTEQDPQVKRTIIDVFSSQHDAAALVALGRKETDLEMKKNIVRRLVDMRSPEATQFLEEILK